MFSLSNIIIQTEIYAIENEKLIEVKMALIFRKLIILISSCLSLGGIVVSLLENNCSQTGHAVVDLRLEVKCEPDLIHYQRNKNKAQGFHISINV